MISATLNCQNIIQERRNNNLPVYNFGLGANSIAQPQFYIDSLKKHAHKKDYKSSSGIPELKAILGNNLLVGNGFKEIIFIIQLSFLNLHKNGKIIHITPSWVSYKEQLKIINKLDCLIEIETTMNNNYKIDLSILENILKQHENTLLIFNNPNNPLGLYYNNQEIEKIASVIKKYNCIVLADEIYLHLVHNEKINSMSYYRPNQTIEGKSVSKDLGCGGYRLGWALFPEELKNLYQLSIATASSIYSSSCTPIQYATADMLANQELFHKHCKLNNNIYSKIVNTTNFILKKSKLKFIKPNAAWYIFVNFSNYEIQLRKYNIKNSYDLTNYLMNKFGIICVAGESFNVNGLNIRFSLVDKINNIIDGMNILVKFLNQL